MPSPSGVARFFSVLEKFEAGFETFFDTRLVRCEPSWIRDGPFGSVLRFSAYTAEREYRLFAKIFGPQNMDAAQRQRQLGYLTTEYTRTLEAREAFSATPSVGVVRPVVCFPEYLALVTEEAPGVGLNVVLKRLALCRTRTAREAAVQAVRRTALWLRTFQDGVRAQKDKRQDHRRYLNVRLLALLEHQAITRQEYGELLGAFDRTFALVKAADLDSVAAHCDLCPCNILVAPDRVTILDLAASLDRSRYLDIAHLYMHLAIAGRHLYLGRELTEDLQRTLLSTFEPGLGLAVPLFRLMLLQNLVTHLRKLVSERASLYLRLRHELRVRHSRHWTFELCGLASSQGRSGPHEQVTRWHLGRIMGLP